MASHIESLASPGGICVSGPVHDKIAAILPVRFEDLGLHGLDAGPVRVWRVQGTEAAAGDRVTRARPLPWRSVATGAAVLVALLGWLVIGRGEARTTEARLAASEWARGAEDLAELRARAAEASADDPTSAEAYRARALVALVARDHDIAVGESEQALERNPNDLDALALLAGALVYSGRAPRALETAQHALAREPGSLGLYYVVGRAQRQLGRRDEAIHAFEQALAYEPANASALANLAVLYAETGRDNESQRMVERLRGEHPDFSGTAYANALPFADPLDAERLAQGLRKLDLP